MLADFIHSDFIYPPGGSSELFGTLKGVPAKIDGNLLIRLQALVKKTIKEMYSGGGSVAGEDRLEVVRGTARCRAPRGAHLPSN